MVRYLAALAIFIFTVNFIGGMIARNHLEGLIEKREKALEARKNETAYERMVREGQIEIR